MSPNIERRTPAAQTWTERGASSSVSTEEMRLESPPMSLNPVKKAFQTFPQ